MYVWSCPIKNVIIMVSISYIYSAQVIATGRNKSFGAQLSSEGISFLPSDMTDKDTVMRICKNVDVVFHTAAKCEPWGERADFEASNVLGTQNVIDACIYNQVKRLVYVSTPSVYFGHDPGNRMHVNETERLPYPEDLPSEYARSKLLAEHLIDKAYLGGLPAISIRPRGIIGVGDTTILPRILDRLRRRKLPYIGDGQNVIDLTHVENVVEGCLCAMAAPSQCLGKVYNITNDEPVAIWSLIHTICETLPCPKPVNVHIAYSVAICIATIIEVCLLIYQRY